MRLLADIRLAIRRLSKERNVTAAAVLTLAIGIGGCTAMYAIVRAVLLKSMGVVAPEQLVVMWPQLHGESGEFPYSAYRELQRRSTSFDGIALMGSTNWPIGIPLHLDGRTVYITQSVTSGNFFDVLGARASLGRTFVEDDDRPGAPSVMVLSDRFWHSALGGDPRLVGQLVRIGPDSSRIIGVVPPEFFFPDGADVWQPAASVLVGKDKSPADAAQILNNVGAFHLVGRLRPGVSMSAARTEITGAWRMTTAVSDPNVSGANPSSMGVSLTPLVSHIFGTARRALWLLLGSVGLVLLIACANVAGLIVARNAARGREFAVRAALGATSWDLTRQTLADATVLTTAAGALGIMLAGGALPLLVGLSPTALVRLADTRIDWTVVTMAIGVTALAALVVGMIPTAQFWGGPSLQPMKATSTGSVRTGLPQRMRAALIVAQITLTVVLFVGGALTFKSFRRLVSVDLGYSPARIVSADISQLDQTRYTGYPAILRAAEDIINRVSSLPSVQSAAGVLTGPFAHGSIGWDSPLLLDGQIDAPATWLASPMVNVECVTPRYFETMGIALLRGRDFTNGDRADAPPVVVVSDTLAEHFWPGQDPIGQRLRSSLVDGDHGRPAAWQTVVGVVRAARYRELDRTRDDFYIPLEQGKDFAIGNIVVRTAGDTRALVQAIGAALSTVDPQLSAKNVATMDAIVDRVQMPWRFNMVLFVSFSVVAIGLTVVALVGLIAATVSWRRREIGIRVALGAQRRQVVHPILLEGVRLVLAGVVIGLGIAVIASRMLSNLLFGVSAHDAGALIMAAAAVFCLATLACYFPARRAASLDPSKRRSVGL